MPLSHLKLTDEICRSWCGSFKGAALGVVFGLMLGGCSFSLPKAQEAPVSAARPADQLVGRNIDALVAQLGQPKRSQSLDNDQTSYVWQIEIGDTPPLTGSGGLYDDGVSPGYVSDGYTPVCRINVIASANGVITQATTEESNGTGTPNGVFRRDNICDRYLRAKSRS
jgi:hypothetical protein